MHINDPTVVEIAGAYRGVPVTHFYNPATGVNVIATPAGQYVSGWHLAWDSGKPPSIGSRTMSDRELLGRAAEFVAAILSAWNTGWRFVSETQNMIATRISVGFSKRQLHKYNVDQMSTLLLSCPAEAR